MIDLHSHTTASDGSCTPTELVLLAKQVGLSALGVSDHDTTDGLAEASAAAEEQGLELVPGIEISVDYAHGEFHLLGYYVDYRNEAFTSRIRYLQENRFNRNGVMLQKMQAMGFEITMEEIVAESGGGQVGRPHMARALMKKGYVSSVQEAFDEYLADGKPLHVPKVKLAPVEAIELVHSARGAAVLAHPKYMEFPTEEELAAEIGRLKDAGLDGLECYYSQHTEAETQQYLELARRFGLVVSGGSDFHGVSKPNVPLGVVYRGTGAGDELLAALKRAAGRA
jgi:3',5'-nucleoside bisphosphate phosphatase